MNTLAIIPARGGSKRIPRKNIKEFLGKPIIGYAIEAALNIGVFTEIMVSTDSPEIADIAIAFGANVPFLRSPKTASDTATTSAVLIEVLNKYKDKGKYFDFVCCIYPTSVLIKSTDLLAAYKLLRTNSFDMVLPVVPFSYPIQRALKVEGGKASMVNPIHQNTRSQDLPARYHDCGQFYWFKTKPFLQSKNLWMSKTGAVILSETQVQDIDNEADWEMALIKYQLNQK